VVQAEASVLFLASVFLLLPTNNILEQTATGICPFADIDAISLCTHAPVLKRGANHAKAPIPAKIREEQGRWFRLHASVVSAGVARKVVAFRNRETFLYKECR